MKKILVPCDFSKQAINAFRMALDIAQQSNGIVHLLNVVNIPVVSDPVVVPAMSFEVTLLKDFSEKAEKEFAKIIGKYNTGGVKVVTSVQFGGVCGIILEYIGENNIDLVLMGSHGATGLQELLMGSNAEKIVRKSPVPVLIVKNYHKGPIKNIVFPNTLDLDDQDDLVSRIKALQNFFKAHLHIVWINTPVNFMSDVVTSERLEAFVKRYGLRDCTTNTFNHLNEEEGILQFRNIIKGDMIAMGTHGRKGIAHIVNGSLTEDVVNHTDKLVWTYTLKNELIEA
ncbi:MAG: universal stress protein UspA [Marivirga sp.]|nr:universal stress protein UspA [Marivirga sp.]